jgi:hypothetical protein
MNALRKLVDQMENVLCMGLIDHRAFPTSIRETLSAMTEAWTELGWSQEQIQDRLKMIDEFMDPPPPPTTYQFRPANPERADV